jgi:iron-sulfur cluster assembly accessory protein
MIQLSQTAIAEVLRLRARSQNPELKLRISVIPSGCLDFSYSLLFDQIRPDDQVYDCRDIQVIVSSGTLDYVDGLVLDYSEDLMGGGFRFHNPKAIQSCGCGNSFLVAAST